MTGARLRVVSEPTLADRDAVAGPLIASNARSGFPSDFEPVAILLDDDAGRTVGGLWGKTVYGWLFVEYLVVPPDLRGRDLGTALMREAECIAAGRGCVGAWLTTFTFQARDFYEKLGFSIFGQLEDSPPGNARLFMRKRFTALDEVARQKFR